MKAPEANWAEMLFYDRVLGNKWHGKYKLCQKHIKAVKKLQHERVQEQGAARAKEAMVAMITKWLSSDSNHRETGSRSIERKSRPKPVPRGQPRQSLHYSRR